MSHKIGILGTGHIAHKMASTIAQMDGYENYAVASRSQDKACQFAAQYQIPHAYGSYEALAADPEVELIYIATPHSSHYDNARLCVLHDKPVLCEKAFTANALEAERLLVLAKERGVFITEAIWTRYMPLMLKVVQLVNEGAIGRPNTLSANLSYVIHQVPRLVRPELAGGSLLDIGIYPITFAAMVFGSDIERTVAVCSKTDTGVDAQETITQFLSDNRMAVLHSSMYCRSDRKGIISGDTGYLVVENINCPQVVRVYDTMDRMLAEYYPPQDQINGYEYQVRASIEAIEKGQLETPYIPHAEILRMMRYLDNLRQEWGVVYPNDSRTDL